MDNRTLVKNISEILGKAAKLESYKKGEVIIKQGEKTPFYIIKYGTCKVFIYDKFGGEVLLSYLNEGSTIGDMSNITQSLTTANVSAETDVDLYKIEEVDFDQLVTEIPSLAKSLYTQLCNRLDRTNQSLSKKFDDLMELNNDLEKKVQDQVKDLREKNEELESLMKSHDHFVSVAVHDLRSPLSTVIGYIELLNETMADNKDEQIEKLTSIIHKNCHNMLDLINDILDISKIKNNKIDICMEILSIRPVLEEVYVNNSIITQNKGMNIELEVEKDLPDCRYDPKRLLEVLTNLVSNAIKFSEKGSTVTVGAKKDGDRVCVFVKDEGQGIPEEDQAKLFQEFQQLSTRSTAGEKGTGLGLAIVDKLVKLHGGVTRVDSKVGQGTTFSFNLKTV